MLPVGRCAKRYGFGDMCDVNTPVTIQVGERPGDSQDTVVPTATQSQLIGRIAQHPLGRGR